MEGFFLYKAGVLAEQSFQEEKSFLVAPVSFQMNPWIVSQLSNLHSIFPFPSFGKSDQIRNRGGLYFFSLPLCVHTGPTLAQNQQTQSCTSLKSESGPTRCSVPQKGAHPFSPQSCEILLILDKYRSQCALNHSCSCSPAFAVVQGMLRKTAPK